MLVERFVVIEAPARARFGRDPIAKLFSEPIHFNEIKDFIQNVTALKGSGLGWVDLYVASKSSAFVVR